ncbi:small secreted protein [Streptomyces sp. TP-A0874]|uniref:small secreted protein n=1 Tax=Streptomyces sp. TP-A0874 TaxID=549819 RepID=UPI00147C3D5E|nr:small secreted protein [Streptomyces sp. TP-A0874]
MNNKLAAALSGGAVLMLVLSGCAEGNQKVDEYAKRICDQLGPQLKKISQANQSITSTAADGKPEDIKKADSAAFDKISKAYAAMSASVEKAGPPPVEGGAKTQQEAVKELKGTSRAYSDLKKSVDRLDTMDQGKFAEGLSGIVEQLDEINRLGGKAIQKFQSGDLGAAMGQQAGCQRPGGELKPNGDK